MDRATIRFEVEGAARASEIIADLRTASETLYFPMKGGRLLGPSEGPAPLSARGNGGRSVRTSSRRGQPGHEDYVLSLQRERQANLEVYFEHADLSMYLR